MTFLFPLQRATATSTPAAVDSTWSCTSCRGGKVEGSAWTAATILQDATATIARRAFTETWPGQSLTEEPAKVRLDGVQLTHTTTLPLNCSSLPAIKMMWFFWERIACAIRIHEQGSLCVPSVINRLEHLFKIISLYKNVTDYYFNLSSFGNAPG